MGGAHRCKLYRELIMPPRWRDDKAVMGCRAALMLTRDCARIAGRQSNVEDGRDTAETPPFCSRGRRWERIADQLDETNTRIWASTSGEAPADAARIVRRSEFLKEASCG